MKILLFLLLIPFISSASEMKVFSMNVHCGLDNWRSRLDIIIGEIIRHNPDVIGLQEVCYNAEMNMGTYIRDELQRNGYKIRSSQTIDTHRSFVKYQEQLLLISRHEAREIKAGYLPGPSFLRNGYVSFKIGDLWFLTTHLHFALASIRKDQYLAISDSFNTKGTIVFGDLNSNAGDDETNVLKSFGWVPYFDGPTFPAENPDKTFDGFWVSRRFQNEVMATTIQTHFLNERVRPSDHLGVSLNILFR